jgi:ribosomal-protein-alanine N-acetyltransferase
MRCRENKSFLGLRETNDPSLCYNDGAMSEKRSKAAKKPPSIKLPRFLSSERIFLRTPQLRDANEFLELMRKSRSIHRNLVSPPTTRKDFAQRLKGALVHNIVGLLICRRSDGAIVGSISLGGIFRGNLQSGWIGYYLGAPYVGEGYMSEAIEVVLKLAFKHLRLHRVEANIQPHNKRSIAVVRGLGFKMEGFSERYLKVCGKWRDHERWAILAEDWRPRRRKALKVAANV